MRGGPKRNFQIFSALDFLAEVTQHIPDKGEHLVRYYGWYSHRQRGIRKKAGQVGQVESDKLTIDRLALDTQKSATGGTLSAWARLINRVYEVDPLECPCCGGQMKIVSFIEGCQGDVIERILRHCSLWEGPLRTSSGARGPPQQPARATPQHDLQFVPEPEYRQDECFDSDGRQSQTEGTGELQLVLDPEFL
ncbi:MAG: transposase [Rubripirellula sp.]